MEVRSSSHKPTPFHIETWLLLLSFFTVPQKKAFSAAAKYWNNPNRPTIPDIVELTEHVDAFYWVVEFLIKNFQRETLVRKFTYYFPKVDGKVTDFVSTMHLLQYFNDCKFWYFDGRLGKLTELIFIGSWRLCLMPKMKTDIRVEFLSRLEEYILARDSGSDSQ